MRPADWFTSIFARRERASTQSLNGSDLKSRAWRALGTQLRELQEALTTAPPPGTKSIWYAGLAAEPAEFTRQLADLHMSIERENQLSQSLRPAGEARVEPVR